MTDDRLRLERGRWYAWHMLPGYSTGFEPYSSPIKVRQVTPTGSGRSLLEISFFNALYTQGLQHFELRLRVVGRRAHHLIAEIDDAPDRHAVVGTMSSDWLRAHCSQLVDQDPSGAEIDVDAYLDAAFHHP